MTPAKMFDGDLWVLASDVMQLAENAYKNGQTDEREACAKMCEQSEIPIPIDVWHESTKKEMTEHTALALAKAIRVRRTHET